MRILDIQRIPALYTFEEHGGDDGRTRESRDCVSVSTIKDYLGDLFGFSNYDVDFTSNAMKMKAWMGLAFEDRLVKDMLQDEPGFIPHPGEYMLPSGAVMGHPDGINDVQLEGDFGLDEFKHTYTSIRHYDSEAALEKQEGGMCWHYIFQAKSYAAILQRNELDVTEARIWVLCVVGDWREEREPILVRSWVRWDRDELAKHAELLEKTAVTAWDWKQIGGKK